MNTNTTPTSGAADLLTLIEAYAEARHLQGHSSYNAQTATALQAVKDELAAGQATAARQPHRSGCTAGSDEECVQRGCGTNCPAVSPRADSPPAPVLDERDDFEKVFPLPSGCVRVGAGYAATGYSNWAAHTHCERWQGWQARAARDPADSVQEDAARYRWLAASCRSTSEHWGGRWSIIIDGPAPKSHDSEDDFDAAVDAARKQGANHD